MKKQSRGLSLSRETLYTLEPGSLVDAKGGTSPLLGPAVGITIRIAVILSSTLK